MVTAAELIGRQFSFARVDLYVVGRNNYLGEIALAPMGGLRPPLSEKLDLEMGARWQRGIYS